MTQFFTFIAFFRLTFQRDIFNKLLVNGLHRGDSKLASLDVSIRL